MENREPARLRPHSLLLGILMSANEPSSYVDPPSRAQFADALEDLTRTLKAPSPEVVCLDGAAYLRENHGLPAGRTALRTTTEFLPRSSMTRSDLIMTDWSLLCELPAEDRAPILEEIASEYSALDLAVVDTDALETLILAEVLALTLLGRLAERNVVVARDAAQHVHSPGIKTRISYLLSTATPDLARVCG